MTAAPAGDERAPVARYEWERVLRRCQLSSTTKYVGFVLAQYANADGTSAYPSTGKLARVTCLSERTVRKGLTELRDLGLIVRDRRGGYRGDFASSDSHHLAIPVDLLERVALLDPDESEPAARAASPRPARSTEPAARAASIDGRQGDGTHPNRHLTTGEPASGAPEPASDDRRTGSTYLLPTQDQTQDPTHRPTRGVRPSATTDRARAVLGALP